MGHGIQPVRVTEKNGGMAGGILRFIFQFLISMSFLLLSAAVVYFFILN